MIRTTPDLRTPVLRPTPLPIQSFLIVPVVHDSAAAVVDVQRKGPR